MFSKILENKSKKLILICLSVVMVLSLAVTFVSNTLAQATPITVTLENPSGDPGGEREILVPFNLRANGVASWDTSNEEVAILDRETATSSLVTITGLKPGALEILLVTDTNVVSRVPFHIVDSNNISAYTLTRGDETFFARSGDSAAIAIETTPAAAKDSITWSSRNPNVATVNEAGVITATSNRGFAIIQGEFTDKWGTNQLINYFVVIDSTNSDILIDLLEAAKALEETDYTADSWTNSGIEKAIEDAEAILAKENPTDDEIKQATDNLKDAINALEKRPDNTELGDLLESIKDLDPDVYTPGSWEDSNIEQIIKDAEEILKNPNATEDEIEKIIEDLNEALDKLVEKPDTSVLEDMLEDAKALEKDDYTPDSWQDSNIEQAIKDAQSVLDNPNSTEDELEKAISDLFDAMESLVEKVNKSRLSEILANAKNLIESEHTPNSWRDSNIEQAIKDAELLLEDPNASEEAVNNAIQNLETALATVVKRANKSGLENSIISANNKVAEQYTPNSWDAVEAALGQANIVRNDNNASQEQVNLAKEALDTALENLIKRANKEALVLEINKAENKNTADYSVTTWNVLEEALNAANVVYQNPNATQADVDEAVANLKAATDALVFIGDLNKTIDMVDGFNENDFTPSGWNAIQEALVVAKEVQSNPNATQAEVDAALEGLNEAIDTAPTAGNKGDLNLIIQIAQREVEGDYTADSWKQLQTALDAAKEVQADVEATQSQINTATSNLLDALGNLQKRADKTALQTAINQANNLSDTNFTIKSWDRLQEVLTTASNLMDNTNASQEEVDAATAALQDALKDLVSIADLAQAIAGAELIDTDKLTPESREELLEALNNAREVLADSDANQSDVNQALADLNAAIDAKVNQPEFIDQIRNLEVGGTFEADGYTWRIVRKDEDGHAIVTTEFLHTTTMYNPTPTNYNNSQLHKSMNAFYENNLDIMKQYASGVQYNEINATAITNNDDITSVDKDSAPTAFALGLGDINTSSALNTDAKRVAKVGDARGANEWYWIRTGVNSNENRHMSICYAGIRYFTQANTEITQEKYLRPAVMIDLNK
jgi:hypothetical protein